MELKELEDRIALRELVDKIAILGDAGDVEGQVQLFTENAVSETIAQGKTLMLLQGRENMAVAFKGFLKDIETVYHLNGQQVVTLNGDRATGTCYCLATLIGNENGRKTTTTIGATYEDEYIRENGRWLIAKRVGHFRWQHTA